MVGNACYSHNSDEWETPDWLFQEYDAMYDFDLDVCATPENAKCKRFFTKEDDGLSREWGGAGIYTVWCNPPYSEVSKWVKKAYEESKRTGVLVVMLLPSRTDTKWFHEYIWHYRATIHFLRGRIRFKGAKNNAPFPSMIVIW